jgi:hypothetical protein
MRRIRSILLEEEAKELGLTKKSGKKSSKKRSSKKKRNGEII